MNCASNCNTVNKYCKYVQHLQHTLQTTSAGWCSSLKSSAAGARLANMLSSTPLLVALNCAGPTKWCVLAASLYPPSQWHRLSPHQIDYIWTCQPAALDCLLQSCQWCVWLDAWHTNPGTALSSNFFLGQAAWQNRTLESQKKTFFTHEMSRGTNDPGMLYGLGDICRHLIRAVLLSYAVFVVDRAHIHEAAWCYLTRSCRSRSDLKWQVPVYLDLISVKWNCVWIYGITDWIEVILLGILRP